VRREWSDRLPVWYLEILVVKVTRFSKTSPGNSDYHVKSRCVNHGWVRIALKNFYFDTMESDIWLRGLELVFAWRLSLADNFWTLLVIDMTTNFSLQDVSQTPNLELFSSLKTRVDQASFLTVPDITVKEKRLMGRALNEWRIWRTIPNAVYLFAWTKINRIRWLSRKIYCYIL